MKKPTSKKRTRPSLDELLPEYDFSGAAPNPYASRVQKGSAVILLEPDVAAAFPTAEEANDALRARAGLIARHGHLQPPGAKNR